jgi:hypothetical protein
MTARFRGAVKYFFTLVLPVAGLSAMLGSCASTPCNSDSCYERKISSVDPYDEGDVAQWGTEKKQKARDKQLHREFNR